MGGIGACSIVNFGSIPGTTGDFSEITLYASRSADSRYRVVEQESSPNNTHAAKTPMRRLGAFALLTSEPYREPQTLHFRCETIPKAFFVPTSGLTRPILSDSRCIRNGTGSL